MKKLLKWVWNIIEVIIIIYVIAMTAFILNKNKYGFTQFGDYVFSSVSLFDEKNNPTLSKGDLLIVKNTNDINKGDLIYYYAVYSEKYIIKSDVVEEVKNDDYSSLYTIKDDKNSFNISSTKVLGKYATTYNKLGTVLDVIESKIGFLFLVLLPIMIIFIYQIYELVIVIRYERVDKDEQEDDQNTVKEDVKKPTKKDNQDDIEIL